MSSKPTRKDPFCLNCGAKVHGPYCHHCGQKNIEPHESFFDLLKHFVFDLFHFDGKFFISLKFLILRPGFLTKEYMLGRRAKYLNPIQMYLFTSATFFIIVFSTVSTENSHPPTIIGKESVELESLSVTNYDSVQSSLPPMERDGWVLRQLNRKVRVVLGKYQGREAELFEKVKEKFIHSLPTWMMISLPFFALALLLLNFRRHEFYFVDHFIFSVHLYVAQYFFLLLFFVNSRVYDFLNWEVFSWLSYLILAGIFIYSYKAIRNFYAQSRVKTVLKLILLSLIMFFVAAFIVVALGIQSFLFI